MALALLAIALANPPLVRDLRPGKERKYRVEVVQEAGDAYAYRLRLKMIETKAPKGSKGKPLLDVWMTDYHGTTEGLKVSARQIGGGQMPLEPSGLPAGLSVVGPQGPVWLPLLSLTFPGGEEGEFDLPGTDVGAGLRLLGKGKLSRKEGRAHVDLDGSLSRAETDLGKLTVSTTLDGGGWPKQSKGTLVSADGTYRFTLDRV